MELCRRAAYFRYLETKGAFSDMEFMEEFGMRPPGAQKDSRVSEDPVFIIIIREMRRCGKSLNYRLCDLEIARKSVGIYDLGRKRPPPFVINCEMVFGGTWNDA